MRNETNQTAIRVAPPSIKQASRRAAILGRHLPAIAKGVVIVPVIMALLGAEVQLRLSPQLDVLLAAAGVCGMWGWVAGSSSTHDPLY